MSNSRREPDQNDTWVIHLLYMSKPAKILVFREEDAPLRVSQFH
jgi:hypothetical protein